MNCPNCNSSNAYLGFMTIKCVNPNCEHYSSSYMNEKAIEFFLSEEGKRKMSQTVVDHISENVFVANIDK
jgi:hypothetical protein